MTVAVVVVVAATAKTLAAVLATVAVVVVAAAVLVVVVAATAAFGHVAGLLAEGDPHHPPNSSLTAFLGLPSPEARTQHISKTITLFPQALTPAVSNL